ncbi:MAG TPA: replicative DNA helicase [Alphaproteobacteria bacterium]|nr:replicative DNA helicase [Alphaproteobacteria bacterium]
MEPSVVTPLRDEERARTRELPHNLEAEQRLLGAVLVNNLALTKVADFLRGEHFYEPLHGRIYDACVRLIERGQIANPVTLKNLFEADAAMADLGGAQYLARLAGSAVTVAFADHYGKIVFDLHLRRQLIRIGEEVMAEAVSHTVEKDANAQIEVAEQKLFDLATTGEVEGGFRPFNAVLTSAVSMAEAAHKREGQIAGAPTGFTDLDKLLGGMQASDLIILAGRPSMGKTALATNIAFNAARRARFENDGAGRRKVVDGAVVGIFSLEMSAEQLALRILAEVANVDSDKIRKGELSNDDFAKVVKANQEIAALPFYIDDTPALSISALRTRARRLQRIHGLSMVVVDYLQLLRGGQSVENRVQEISDITRGLKALAKELDVPVLALSQLSRAVEQREDKRPQLSDLRESGSIEQDADVVMFIYRAEYYLQRQEPEPGTDKHHEWQEKMERVHSLAEVIIGKQRHGPTGTVTLRFEGSRTKFDDYIPDNHLPADAPF